MAKKSKNLPAESPNLMDSAVDLINSSRDTPAIIKETINNAKSVNRDILTVLQAATTKLKAEAEDLIDSKTEHGVKPMQLENLLVLLEHQAKLTERCMEQYMAYNYIPSGKVTMADVLKRKQSPDDDGDDRKPSMPGHSAGPVHPINKADVE